MSLLPVDDQLYQGILAAAAAQEGKTAEAFAQEALLRAVGRARPLPVIAHAQQTSHNGLRVMALNGSAPTIDPDKVRQSLMEEGF